VRSVAYVVTHAVKDNTVVTKAFAPRSRIWVPRRIAVSVKLGQCLFAQFLRLHFCLLRRFKSVVALARCHPLVLLRGDLVLVRRSADVVIVFAVGRRTHDAALEGRNLGFAHHLVYFEGAAKRRRL